MVPFKIAVLNYFMIAMIVLAIVNLIFNALTTRYRVVAVASVVILINSATLFYFNYNHEAFSFAFIPFTCIYGPLFHAHIRFFSIKPIDFRYLLPHFSVVLCFFLFYLIIIIFAADTDTKVYLFYLLHFLEGLSMVVYGVLIMLMHHSHINLKLRNIYVLNAFLLTIVSASIIISVERAMHQKPSLSGFSYQQIPFCILIGVFGWSYFLSCFYVMSKKTDILPEWLKLNISKIETKEEPLMIEKMVIYSKSRLSDQKLDEYLNSLNGLMAAEKIYIESDITLEKLAKKLRMPPSHLTQLLNIGIGQNFYSYINGLRAEYALSLIQHRNYNIYDVYIKSGFSNRVSFNRYFKKLTGNTPSEYIKSFDGLTPPKTT